MPDAPSPTFEDHAPTLVQRPQIQRLGRFAVGLLFASLLLFTLAAGIAHQAGKQQSQQLQQLTLVETRLQQELQQWNQGQAPQALALRRLLRFGQDINQHSKGISWFGQLHAQTLQSLTTQALESLSRPVAAINTDANAVARLESQVRLDTLPRLAQLRTHIEAGQAGFAHVLFGFASLLLLAGLVFALQWWSLLRRFGLEQRIHVLSRALHTQQSSEQRLEGAHAALEGVLKALGSKQRFEHHNSLMMIAKQLDDLHHSGRSVLQFARSFHELSCQNTQVAKMALTSEQRNHKADSHLETVQAQLEGLRADIRAAAQGLRKAAGTSRQLSRQLDSSQTELALDQEPPQEFLQQLVEENQLALKEAIEGLLMASQKINSSQQESQHLAEHLRMNQNAWNTLLDQVEQGAETAAKDSEQALAMAKRLLKDKAALQNKAEGQPKQQAAAASPSLAGPSLASPDSTGPGQAVLQATKAPPQLLP